MNNMSSKTYHGSCACGKVRFEVRIDLEQGTFKCNCTVCTKTRLWGQMIKVSDFKLTAGESDLSVWGERILHHFCKYCGAKVFAKPAKGGETMVIVLSALDDLDPRDWVKAPVKYFDGRNDNFSAPPEFAEHL